MRQEQIFYVALGQVSFHPIPPLPDGKMFCMQYGLVGITDCLSCSSEQQKVTDSAKRKLDDLSCRGDGSRKCLKTDIELETTVDMDIEETTGDNQCKTSL